MRLLYFTCMKKIFISILLITFICLPKYVSCQQVLQLTTEFAKSYAELTDAYGNLNKVESILNKLNTENQKPDTNGLRGLWSGLADKYKRAAEVIRNSRVTNVFKEGDFVVPIEQIQNCNGKDETLRKLKNLKAALDKAIIQGMANLSKLSEYNEMLEKSKTALAYLMDIYSRVPFEISQWNWLELERDIKPELVDLLSIIKSRQKDLLQEIGKVRTMDSNLSSNLKLFENYINTHCDTLISYRGAGNSSISYYGGNGYCQYSMQMENVIFSITISNGSISKANLSCIAKESINGSCSVKSMAPFNQAYTTNNGSLVGNRINIYFPGGASKYPANFTGLLTDSGISGIISWKRIGVVSPLSFTVVMPISMSR